MEIEKVKTIGRTLLLENTLWMALSGTGAEFSVTGTRVSIILLADNTWNGPKENLARVAVYSDGRRVIDLLLDEPKKVVSVFESDAAENHVIRVIKLSESAMSTCGISRIEVEGEIEPTGEKGMLIEFVGDSITCGYGVEDENRDHHFSTGTEDVTKAYAYKTAENLDADYSMVSFSGYGIVSGYTETGEKKADKLVPEYYEKFGFSYGTYLEAYLPQNVTWDFTRHRPDLIVINLGTNDYSYVLDQEDRREEYIAGYVRFLETVRTRNPGAGILCTLGIMGTGLCPAAEAAVERYRSATGDHRIDTMWFAEQLPEDGLAADWHPTEKTQTKAAEKLSAWIAESWRRL